MSTKKPMFGKYMRSAKGLNNYNELTLETNHTFIFSSPTCAGDFGTQGTWMMLKNKLILNNYPFVRSNDSVSVLLENKKINENDSIAFEIIDDSLELLIGVNIAAFLKNNTIIGTVSDINGIAKLKKEKYDSILIRYIAYNDLIIKQTNNSEYYKIKMRLENGISEKDYNSSLLFINESWKISKKSYINHNTKKIVRRVVIMDPRFNKHKKRNAYIFIKSKEM